MRVEESVGELRIIKPGAERISERLGLAVAGVMIGMPGTFALLSAWQEITAAAPSVAWGVLLSEIAAFLFWKAARLGDLVCVVRFDLDRKTLEREGRVLARFDEVRAVRYVVDASWNHHILAVVHHKRGFRDVFLCSLSGAPSDRAVFEQAAARIAEVVGVRVEHR